MNVNITARHFKAHETLQEYIVGEITKLQKFYDGIVNVDVVLSYEKPSQSVKTAEIKASVQGAILTAMEKSNDFVKSVDAAVGKIERQLKKYKSKQREKKKATLRQRQAKV